MSRLDPKRTAVLVMDFQTDILAMLGDSATAVLGRAASVAKAARAADVPVFFVVVGFRPGYPEMSPRNATFKRVAEGNRFVTTTPGSDIHPALERAPGDIVIFKHRVGAFPGTDLDMILRAKSIDTLVLLGLSTSGVVLSTLRHAADHDYQLLLAADGCADPDPEIHRVLVEKIFPRQATVVTCADVVTALG